MHADMITQEPIGMVLTPEEYDSLPPNSRRELVDGVIRLMASPTSKHQEVVDNITAELKRLCPREWWAIREQEVRLGDDHRRNPDVIVIRAEAYDDDNSRYLPQDVLLAVEVVSIGTRAADMHEKPYEYARAGLRHFWRVDLKPEIAVNTFRLGDHAHYIQTGVFTAGDTVNAPGLPWALVPVDVLSRGPGGR